MCECGHPGSSGVRLPGHPDGAEECQVEKCDCGHFRPMRIRKTFADDPDEYRGPTFDYVVFDEGD